ncbi:MAG: GNAT family N-acetyltransferase, partial [Nocardioides sp.]|nr:GNAT family N-acetyltransferase [Nocardioides sp.]
MPDVRVVSATADIWPRLGQVFGPRANNPDSCWCQRFRRHDATDNRSALHQEIEDALVPIGLVAYLADNPIGWTRVVPRHTLPGITDNRALARILDDDPNAWWVTCFVVRREHRGGGVGVQLLESAVEWASEHDGTVLDGHPVDTAALSRAPSPSAVFTGTMA